MSDRHSLLIANETFYRNINERNLAQMNAMWARGRPVACVHPGWEPLLTREAVMESWQRILAGPLAPRIKCRRPQALFLDKFRGKVLGKVAMVVCLEEIAGRFLAATNVFVNVRRSDWRMVHHQAGPIGQAPPDEARDAPTSLH